MSKTPLGDLFFEVISMMSIRNYNILPFNFLINNKKMNNRFIERGELDKVITITDSQLLQSLAEYRLVNYQMSRELFQSDKMGISMVFDHTSNGMRTLVLFSNDDIKGLTSKDTIVDFIGTYLKIITQNKTEGKSIDPFLKENKVSGIFILPVGLSSFSNTYIDVSICIEIITEDDIKSRVYDNVLQSHYRTIPQDTKNLILAEVGLNAGNIPSITKKNDITCQILGLQQNHLLVATRGNVASEETIHSSIFIRDIK